MPSWHPQGGLVPGGNLPPGLLRRHRKSGKIRCGDSGECFIGPTGVFAIKQASSLGRTHRGASLVAYINECLADLIDSTRATFVAERVPSIKIEGMRCMWNV